MLVIIGPILAGIIKCQELIANAMIKRTYNVQKERTTAIYSYFDRCQFYPGDDSQAQARSATFPPSVINVNENALIAVGAATIAANFACNATGTEQCDLWPELRNSDIFTGSGFTNPTHPYSGAIAVSYVNVPAIGAGSIAQLRYWFHFQNISYDVCQLIDQHQLES